VREVEEWIQHINPDIILNGKQRESFLEESSRLQ